MEVLYPKARIMEISSNGLHPEKLVPIIKKYPNIKVRFSLEGDEATSNRIRGEENGAATKIAGLRMLQEAGGTDLGFAFVIQDENVDQLVKTYEFAKSHGFELATSTLHNAWQFYKNDNYFYDRVKVARQVEGLVSEMCIRDRPYSVHEPASHPVSLYAATKRSNELMAHSYSSVFGLPTTGLRFFTVYGPWGRPDMALFLFSRAILAGEPIQVFNHGHHKRDFTYVDDIVEGVVRVLDRVAKPDPRWDSAHPDPAYSAAPVSYTHLDVYKRQPRSRCG